MSIYDLINGKWHKKYYKKHKSLPTYFDSLGRMPLEHQEQILQKALESGVTWQELTKQKHNDLM